MADRAEIGRVYAAARSRNPADAAIAVLALGPGATWIAAGRGASPDPALPLDLGTVSTARKHFHQEPPTALELESAIHAIEEEVMRARSLAPRGVPLFTASGAIRDIARACGAGSSREATLSIEDVEALFHRLADTAQGAPVSRAGMPVDAEFAATLTILREILHHLGFPSVTILRGESRDGDAWAPGSS